MNEFEERQIRADFVDYLSTFATAHKRERIERVLLRRTRHLSVALDRVSSVHDASAVMRSCDIFGVQNVTVWTEGQAFKATRGVALGSAKWLSVEHFAVADETAQRAWYAAVRNSGRRIVGLTTDPSAVPIEALSVQQPLCLVFGPEDGGVGPVTAEYVDEWVKIPSRGGSPYYNLSVCAALSLDSCITRLHDSSVNWRLSTADKEEVRLIWYGQMYKRRQLLFDRFLAEKELGRADLNLRAWPPSFWRLMGWRPEDR